MHDRLVDRLGDLPLRLVAQAGLEAAIDHGRAVRVSRKGGPNDGQIASLTDTVHP